MAEDTVPTFDEFAKTQGMRPRMGGCMVCALPPEIREQLGQAFERGFRGVPMRRYLADSLAITHVSTAMLHNHMQRGHPW